MLWSIYTFVICLFCALAPDAYPMSNREIHAPITSASIGVKTLHYQDLKRNRPVIVEFWYPTDETSFPAIDLSEESVWIHPKESRNAPLSAQK